MILQSPQLWWLLGTLAAPGVLRLLGLLCFLAQTRTICQTLAQTRTICETLTKLCIPSLIQIGFNNMLVQQV